MRRSSFSLLIVSVSLILCGPYARSQNGNQGPIRLEFDVATIKTSPPSENGWKMEFTSDGFVARGVTMRQIIQDAYGITSLDPLLGVPQWVDKQRFDVQAKFDAAKMPGYEHLTLEQRRVMVRVLLAHRCNLMLHWEAKESDVLALVVAKSKPHPGLKPTETSPQDTEEGALVTVSKRGHWEIQGTSMLGFTRMLGHLEGRTVADQTGLAGKYDISLQWRPDDAAPSDSDAPALPQALEDQLGLKLISARLPVETYVIDSIQMPSQD